MLNLKQEDIDRFWAKVDKEKSTIFYNVTRCWEWTAARHKKGYGHVKIENKLYKSHRISYELAFGEIPNGLWVLHHCDNPPCCNPAHLFLGTNQDNVDDMTLKGRDRKAHGESNGNVKLSDEQVAEIRRRYGRFGIGGETSYQLAKAFGVDRSEIGYIVNYKIRK